VFRMTGNMENGLGSPDVLDVRRKLMHISPRCAGPPPLDSRLSGHSESLRNGTENRTCVVLVL
jgi:hypothetical protein